MLMESIVAILLTLIVSYIYLRAGKRAMSIAVLPLILVPFSNLLAYLLRGSLGQLFSLGPTVWRLIFILAGLAVSVALVGSISTKLRKGSSRRFYLVICVGYCLIFAILASARIVGA